MKTDLVTSIGLAIVGVLISYFVCNLLIGPIGPVSFSTVDEDIGAELAEPDVNVLTLPPPQEDDYAITEDDIPTGNTTEDRRKRQQIILDFYQTWKELNPDQKKYNLSLHDDINIRSVSVVETAAQASLTYLSTLAVLQLDAILTNARFLREVPSKAQSKNQRAFESMMLMEHLCPGVGKVKMTVGIRRSDKMKIQYCITAISAGKTRQEAE